jgi:hypothetical protein
MLKDNESTLGEKDGLQQLEMLLGMVSQSSPLDEE